MEWRLLPSPSHPSPFSLLEGGGEVLLDALIMDEFHPTVSGQLLHPPAVPTVLHVAPALQVLCRNTTTPCWPPSPCEGVGRLALAPIVEGGRMWSLNVGQREVGTVSTSWFSPGFSHALGRVFRGTCLAPGPRGWKDLQGERTPPPPPPKKT